MNILRSACMAAFGVACALLTGCAQLQMGAPVASVDNIGKAKSIGAPVALGDFKPAAAVKDDAGISMRTNTVTSPVQGSFAQYLKENLAVELRAAGLLDPASKTVIGGELTDSKVDSATAQGTGSLGARFVVTRTGAKVFDKELRVDATWESSFVGAVAIPAAINNYGALYRKLIAKLLDDDEFKRALKG